MALLEPDTSTPAPAPVETPAPTPPADPMADAAGKLFDNPTNPPAPTPPADPNTPADPPADPPVETDEQKAEREAREAAETPEQKAEREAQEAKDAERYGAPEGNYEFKLPEGITLDETGAKELSDVARELNLSPASAQRLADIAAAKATRDAETSAAHIASIREGWQTATRADTEFGGDKLPASLAVAQKALKQFGSPELNELVVGAGLGDHPEFIRLLVKVGQATSEAPIVNGAPSATKDAASVMYPNHPRKQ